MTQIFFQTKRNIFCVVYPLQSILANTASWRNRAYPLMLAKGIVTRFFVFV